MGKSAPQIEDHSSILILALVLLVQRIRLRRERLICVVHEHMITIGRHEAINAKTKRLATSKTSLSSKHLRESVLLRLFQKPALQA